MEYRCKNWKDRLVLTLIVLAALFVIWGVAFSDNNITCSRANAAECGYDDYN